jgi:hypothetical protein
LRACVCFVTWDGRGMAVGWSWGGRGAVGAAVLVLVITVYVGGARFVGGRCRRSSRGCQNDVQHQKSRVRCPWWGGMASQLNYLPVQARWARSPNRLTHGLSLACLGTPQFLLTMTKGHMAYVICNRFSGSIPQRFTYIYQLNGDYTNIIPSSLTNTTHVRWRASLWMMKHNNNT